MRPKLSYESTDSNLGKKAEKSNPVDDICG